MTTGASSTKVQYDLRAAKQVERRMLIDAFQILAVGGFPIRDYEYCGMGAIYFVDFAMLHRHLGMEHLFSAEEDKGSYKRAAFNCPYSSVKVENVTIGDLVKRRPTGKDRIVWLDFDQVMGAAHLEDIRQTTSLLSPGSILLVTLDAEWPESAESVVGVKEYYQSVADTFAASLPVDWYHRSEVHRACASIILQTVESGLNGSGLHFERLFYFTYADGHLMVSVGGMICDDDCRKRLRLTGIHRSPYVRTDWQAAPCHIEVPKLTRKERMYLDGHMPAGESFRPEPFDLPEQDLRHYKEIYRFMPSYGELYL